MKQPNILLIMTDQQRRDGLGIAGHPVLMTPTLDHLATQGVRFTRAYTTCPSCIAARRSLLTGQFPATHGMVGYAENVEWSPPPTLPAVLRQAGYQTFMVGRSMHQHPLRRRLGYDHMVLSGWLDQGEYTEWLRRNSPEGSGGYYGSGVMHNDWTARPWHLPESLHQTNWVVNQALDFLDKRDPDCPFFLTVSFLAPHPPLIPPAPYMDRYLRTGVPDPIIGDWAQPPPDNGRGLGQSADRVRLSGEALLSTRAAYYGLINHIDDQLHRLLNPINGIDRQTDGNTIVVFLSDHGEMLGDHYRWRKTLPYEGSAGIPLLIRDTRPRQVDPGRISDRLVCIEDIMPTLLELAGAPVPDTVEGHSLAPLLRGENVPDEHESLHIEHAPVGHALTDGHEKFIWFAADGREQFFDLDADPDECHDRIHDAEDAARIDRWRQRLIEALQNRPEGFTDGKRLIPGRPYRPVLPHALPHPAES